VPRIAAVLLVVTLSLRVWDSQFRIVEQLYDLAYHLPDYKANLINKTQAFRSEEGGVSKKLTDAFADVLENISPKENQKRSESRAGRGSIAPGARGCRLARDSSRNNRLVDLLDWDSAVKRRTPSDPRCEIVDRLSVNEITRSLLARILGPLGTAAIVIVFVSSCLIEREDLRNRLIYVIGSRQLNLTTQASTMAPAG